MKKFLAALLVGAFGISAVAQVVYDYKATFKRVDPYYKVRTIRTDSSSRKAITESYGVTSDSITGYIVLPVCTVGCEGDLVTSMELQKFGSMANNLDYAAYLVRKGDKISKKAGLPFVLKTKVWARAGIFGKNAYVIDDKTPAYSEPSSVKELKNAWMTVQFYTPDGPINAEDGGVGTIDSKLVLKNNGGYQLYYGFMGLDNDLGSTVYNKGFGNVKLLTWEEAASYDWCGGTSPVSGSCAIIQSISGSVIGEFGYEGACKSTPMWDLCDDGAIDPDTLDLVRSQTLTAPIAGTWSLKFNKTLSSLNGNALESAILTKLKAKTSDYLPDDSDYTTSNWDLESSLGVTPGS